MQTRSYQETPTQRKLFGIDAAPAKVRAHGLKETHSWPLVSMGKGHSGAHSASFESNLTLLGAFLKLSCGLGIAGPCIILDVDGANALYRILEAVEHGEVLTPNWTVTRKAGGGTHSVWNFGKGQCIEGKRLRKGPLAALGRVSEYFGSRA